MSHNFKKSLLWGSLFIFMVLVVPRTSAQLEFVHPGIAHTRESIDYVKSRIKAGDPLWTEAWKGLRSSNFAKLKWKSKPTAHVERGEWNKPDIGGSDFSNDGSAAYTHALIWALTGDEAHARKAAEIINAWSGTLQSVSNHDAKLLVGMVGYKYCNAAELLKHGWGKWPEKEQKRFRTMLRDIWYPVIKDFYPTANGNWDASMMQTMAAMGVFLDDREMFDRATDYYLRGEGNGSIGNYFKESGQCQESGRDQGHTQMGLEYLSNTCEIAWNQGIDLYGALDNRLLMGFEYTAKYNLGFDVPYEAYKSYEGRYYYRSLSDDGRGHLRPMYEKVFNHYHNRKGLDATYTGKAALEGRPETTKECSSIWSTLMFAEQPASFCKDGDHPAE